MPLSQRRWLERRAPHPADVAKVGGDEPVAPCAGHRGRHARVGDDDRVVRYPCEKWPRLDQPPSVLHLPRAGLIDRLGPRHQGTVDRIAPRLPHLPHGVVPVRVAESAREQVPIQGTANVAADRVAQVFGVKGHRVVLVDRFAVEHRLNRRALVVDARLVVTSGELRHVPVLPHVEVKPFVVVKHFSRA